MSNNLTRLLSLAMILSSVLFLGYIYRPSQDISLDIGEARISDSTEKDETNMVQNTVGQSMVKPPKVVVQRELNNGRLISVVCTVPANHSCSLVGVNDNGSENTFPSAEMYLEGDESFFTWNFVDHRQAFEAVNKVKARSFTPDYVLLAESLEVHLSVN